MGRIVLFLTSSTNNGDGCIRMDQPWPWARSRQAQSSCWVGGWKKGAQEHDPGTIPIWEMVTYFQNLYEQGSTDERF